LSTAALRAPTDSCAPAIRSGGASAPPPRAAAAAAAWRRGLRAAPPVAATVRVAVPSMGESITEGTVAAILKHPGDAVVEDDVLAQLETDKVTMDVKYQGSAPGVVSKIMAAEGDSVAVGQAFAEIDTDAAAAAAAAPPAAAPAAAPAAEKKGKKEAAAAPAPAPAAAPAPPPKPAAKTAAPALAPPAPAAAGERPERRVKMTRLRSRIAQRLKGAQNTYAMLTTFNEVDMTELMALRAAHKDAFLERHGVKLGFMSAFVRAAADALAAVPSVNGVIDGDEIVYRDYVDISVAVSTPKGLVVPVLRGADRMSFADVERTINELGRKARDGALSIDEMAGGTFTISNGGVFGSLLSTPIINPPQSAILGMHATNMRPAVVGGVVVPRPLMYLALTYDHRLVDGREAVTFLKRVKEVVEDPRRLLLDV
jgi:2-oxoglutarate dehydrogenase E2 component (dihydrolipoamide succinyltransferase)